MTDTPRNGGYTLKGVKTFRGREGYGCNATLCKDGAKLAEVLDEGNGGMVLIRWVDGPEPRSKSAAAFNAFLATLPPDTSFDPPIAVDADLFIGRLVDEHETLAKLRRKAKKAVLFVDGGKLWTCAPHGQNTLEAAIKAVGAKYPDAAILNTRAEGEWLSLVPA